MQFNTILTYKKHTFHDDNHTLLSHFKKSVSHITDTVNPCCNDFTYLKLPFDFVTPSKSKLNFLPTMSALFIVVLLEIALPWFPHMRSHSNSVFFPASLFPFQPAGISSSFPATLFPSALYIWMWGAYSSQKLLPSKSLFLSPFIKYKIFQALNLPFENIFYEKKSFLTAFLVYSHILWFFF